VYIQPSAPLSQGQRASLSTTCTWPSARLNSGVRFSLLYSPNANFCLYQIVQFLRHATSQLSHFFSLFFLGWSVHCHPFFLCFFCAVQLLVFVESFYVTKSRLHSFTVHIQTFSIVSSNIGRSSSMASFANSSIFRFSNSSSKLFNTSAHSILNLISNTFNV